jgi:hypothetical protein
MADHERDSDSSIISRDADSASKDQVPDGDRGPQGTNGIGLTDQLASTTSENAGGNVSGTGDTCDGLDIVFEPESEAH